MSLPHPPAWNFKLRVNTHSSWGVPGKGGGVKERVEWPSAAQDEKEAVLQVFRGTNANQRILSQGAEEEESAIAVGYYRFMHAAS